MRTNKLLIVIFAGFVGLAACDSSNRSSNVNASTEHVFNRDMTKEAYWTLAEDVGAPVVTSVANLELVPIIVENETWVSGEELANRAKSNDANLGQRDAEYLLAHQEEIPKDWRAYYLVFPGTKLRDSRGSRRVPYLYWGGHRWYLDFDWLGRRWRSHDRLVRPSK